MARKDTELLFTTGTSRRLPPDIRRRATMRLYQLNASSSLDSLRMPPSNRLEARAGDRAGQWSVRVNDEWRLGFRFEASEVFDVEIVDYHRGFFATAAPPPKNGMPPIHPGAFIREILEDLDMNRAALAQAAGISSMRISHVVCGERPVTAELALRLGHAFGQDARYWTNLQNASDLKMAEHRLKGSLAKVRRLAA